MVALHYRGERIEVVDGETALQTLERAGFEVRSSCRMGSCQSCLQRACGGDVSGAAQEGLKESWKQQGYFLACRLLPKTDVDIIDADEAAQELDATLIERQQLSADVFRVWLRPERAFSYLPGQFVHVQRSEDGCARAYSLAGGDRDALELHVRRIEGGALSPWLCEAAPIGQKLRVRGPLGTCVYTPGKEEQPLLLAGTSTGLAPLLGIARDALGRGHRGSIDLYHGSVEPSGLYLRAELQALARRHDNLRVHLCALKDADPARQTEPGRALAKAAPSGEVPIQIGSIEALMLRNHKQPKDACAYLCGAPAFVKSARKRLFLAGLPLKSIHADMFSPAV